MQNSYLTVEQRAAKRVAQKHLDNAETFEQRNDSLLGFASRVHNRFANGRKLSDRDFNQIVDGLRRELSGSSMLQLSENYQPATRTRPNGMSFEIYAMNRLAREEAGVMVYSLNATRAFVSPKKFCIDSSFSPVSCSKHLLARTVERGMATNETLSEVDAAIIASIGLTTVWQRAFAKARITTEAIMVPYRGGALLGRLIAKTTDQDIPFRMSVDRDVTKQGEFPASPYHTYSDVDGLWRASAMLATAIDDSLLDTNQFYLHAELDAFCAKYGQAMNEITQAVLWPHAQLKDGLPHQDIDYCIDSLSHELAEIINQPEHLYALRGPKADRRQWQGMQEPEVEHTPVLWLRSA